MEKSSYKKKMSFGSQLTIPSDNLNASTNSELVMVSMYLKRNKLFENLMAMITE